jgi:hemolysin activation/secretion protein
VLPPQRIQEGTVRIQLIEARVGEVRLEGIEHTNKR